MVGIAQKEKIYTIEEYFSLEEKSLAKNEFHNGKIIPIPGANFSHNLIQTNLISIFNNWITTNKLNYW